MKFITALLMTALLSFTAGLYLPWWSLALASFIVAVLIHQTAGKAFLAGFLALFLLWGGLALWIDIRNQHILGSRIGQLLGVGDNTILLVLVTALVGGLVSGFAAMSGSFFRSKKKPSTAKLQL